jgi:hypothetical protein
LRESFDPVGSSVVGTSRDEFIAVLNPEG